MGFFTPHDEADDDDRTDEPRHGPDGDAIEIDEADIEDLDHPEDEALG